MTNENNETKRPLTCDEAREGQERTQATIKTALATGDVKAFIAAQDELRFYTQALELAEELEERQGVDKANAERAALRPVAEEAARKADIDVAFGSVFATFDECIEQMIGAASCLPAMVKAHCEDIAAARELCTRAGVAFTPRNFSIGGGTPNDIHQVIAVRVRASVVRELTKRNAGQGVPFLPPINFIR